MTSEMKFRLAFWILMLATLCVFSDVVLGQPPIEGAMGSFPLPRIVGMSGQKPATRPPPDITLDVYPKIVISNPYKRFTFRIRIRIERDDRNRIYSFSGDCGSDAHAHQREMDGDSPITYTFFQEFTVVSTCYFVACVHKMVEGKVKTVCARQEVKTSDTDGR